MTKNTTDSKPLIAIIAAMSENNIIALNDRIPWRITEDLKRFKMLTMDNEVIMGRKTYEQIIKTHNSKDILPGRELSIISKQEGYTPLENRNLYSSFEKAIENYKTNLTWIIGGGEIYQEAMKYADVLEITKVNKLFPAINMKKTTFPNINYQNWTPIRSQESEGYCFITYVRNDNENGTLKERTTNYENTIKKENKQLLRNKTYDY